MNIENILKDIYELDPSLRSRDSEVRSIVMRLFTTKPDATIDEAFAKRLRQELLSSPVPQSIFNIFRSPYMPFLYTGVAVAIVVIVVTPSLKNGSSVTLYPKGLEIQNTNRNAFGTINIGSNATPDRASTMSMDSTRQEKNVVYKDAPAPSSAVSAPAPSSGMAYYQSEPVRGISIGMPVPEPSPMPKIVYKYVGEKIAPIPKSLNVLQRTNSGTNNFDFSNWNIAGIKLGVFGKVSLSNASFKTADGYDVVVDANYGSLYINESGVGTVEPMVLDSNQKSLSDEVVINIALSFVKKIGLDTSSYGDPMIEKSMYGFPERPVSTNYAKESAIFAPNSFPYTVKFPLLIDKKPVFDEWGNIHGITVSVDGARKKVTNVSGIASLSFKSSEYTSMLGADEALKLALSGNFQNIEQRAGEKEIKLQTPTIGYSNIYQYDPSGSSTELYVPALIFPVVENNPDMPQRRILVPLVGMFKQERPTDM